MTTAIPPFPHIDPTLLAAKPGLVPLPPPVVSVESWTNGSYWRNYRLNWTGQADTGDQLCLLKDVQAYGDARAAAALAGEPVELTKLVDGGWYWVRYERPNGVYTEPALYEAATDSWTNRTFKGWPTSQFEVLRALPTP